MKKILFIGDNSSLGGLKIITNNLYKTIPKKRNQNIYFINSSILNYKNIFSLKKLISLHLYQSKFYKIFLLIDFIKIIIHGIPSKIIILSEINAPLGLLFYKLFKTEYYQFIHGNYSTYLPNYKSIFFKSFKNAKKIFAVSEYSKNLFIKRVYKNTEINLIYWGVSSNILFLDKNIKKERNIIFNGNITKKRKGLDFLLNYISKYEFPYNLIIVSNHDDNDPRAIEKLNLLKKYDVNFFIKKNIKISELRNIYNKCMYNFACADDENNFGEYEGFNMTIIEAAACGTMSIASKNTANECAMKFATGYLIRYNDLEALNDILNGNNKNKIVNQKPNSWEKCWDDIVYSIQ